MIGREGARWGERDVVLKGEGEEQKKGGGGGSGGGGRT